MSSALSTLSTLKPLGRKTHSITVTLVWTCVSNNGRTETAHRTALRVRGTMQKGGEKETKDLAFRFFPPAQLYLQLPSSMLLSTLNPSLIYSRLISTLVIFGRVNCPLLTLNQQNAAVNDHRSQQEKETILNTRTDNAEYRRKTPQNDRMCRAVSSGFNNDTLEVRRLKVLMDVSWLPVCLSASCFIHISFGAPQLDLLRRYRK